MTLTRDEILGFDDRAPEEVAVPELGGSVCVRRLSHAVAAEYLDTVVKEGATLTDIMVGLVQRAVCDESGNLLFTADDIGALADKSNLAVKRMYEAAKRVNGLGEDALEEAAGN